MTVKKMGLGRGFDSLIPVDVLDESFDPTATQDGQTSDLRYISVNELSPNPDQPRRVFDEDALEELSVSVKEHGILQPLIVMPAGGRYHIIAGERRWRAAQRAGLKTVPVLVRTLSQQHNLEIALVENLQRADLNPLEIATAYLKLHNQFNLSLDEIGRRAGGKAVSTISNYLRLLQLPDEAKDALVEGKIAEGHARQILALAGHPDAQAELLELTLREGWSVRKTEQYVIGFRKANEEQTEKRESAVRHTQVETPLTRKMTARFGLPVSHKTTAHGGQLIIRYKTDDELRALEEKLF